MSRVMVLIKMWTLVVCCSFFVGVLANGNITDHNSVLKTEIVTPPLLFPTNPAEISNNETMREILLQKTAVEVEETTIPSSRNVSADDKEEHPLDYLKLLKAPVNFTSSIAPLSNISDQSTTSTQSPQPTNQNTTENTEKPILFSPFTPSNTTSEKQKHNPKEDSEWIQVNGENSEDQLHPFLGRNDRMRNHGPGVPLVRGQLAAILAGIFVVLAVGGYIALLSWRRYLENRYGNREMLVNEEEMSEATDMKYFSVSKL